MMLTPRYLSSVPYGVRFHMIEDPAIFAHPYIRGTHPSGREIVHPPTYPGAPTTGATLPGDPRSILVYCES